MKKAFLLISFLTASCTDVVHYISFNHGGQSVQVLRITVQQNYLNQAPETLSGLQNMGAFRLRSPQYFVRSTPITNGEETGFELRYTAKAGYMAAKAAGIVPAKEDFGFSIGLDPVNTEGQSDNARDWLAGVKYRILLSKNGIGALWRVEVSGYGGQKNLVAVSEFDSFYLIEFPITAWLFNPQETKINFHLR